MAGRRGDRPVLERLLPFLGWLPLTGAVLRADLIAGVTGALVLVPKAMAYAQLSGLPVHFGLYVAFVPAILGALWGSSRHLATGPVAIISLMTAAALAPLAVPFSEDYIELALLLTLMVGVIQFSLGVLRLGAIVNFVSHPVILGFMNAAAIIIALSQMDLLFGIPKGRGDLFLRDVWEMFRALPQLHWPTLAMSVFALALMLLLRRLPVISQLSVLIAVAVTIALSQAVGFEQTGQGRIDAVADAGTRERLAAYAATQDRVRQLGEQAAAQAAQLRALERTDARAAAELRHRLHLLRLDADELAAGNKARWQDIQRLRLRAPGDRPETASALYPEGEVPDGVEVGARRWRVKKIDAGRLELAAGGAVVGTIPQGLPALRVPTVTPERVLSLLSAAIVIALVGFMESIAMAKALSARTRQRIDPDQELIGQGMANLGGAFFQAYPACGSFTGSAINLQAGARTGFAMVFNGLFVVATLLFLTPYLYHLPKATLGVVILLAVTTLITPYALLQTWRANRADAAVAAVTFAVTLLAAPRLDLGILFGAALAVLIHLFRTMRPRVAELGRHPDGALRDVRAHPGLRTSPDVIALRFDDSLYFANASFFEDAVLAAVAARPQAKYLLVVGSGINQMDASGEEVVRHLVERLHAAGITVVFCALKKQVLDVMRRTGLDERIGRDRIFPGEDQALAAIYGWLGRDGRGELLPPARPLQ